MAKPKGQRQSVALLVALIPYLSAQGSVTVAQAAAHFDVSEQRIREAVRLIFMAGVPDGFGDFDRFDRPARLMSYLGLVPSEDSSGERRHHGAITKTGSRHARRLLVEAAWHYRRPPRRGTPLQRRQAGQSAHVLAIAWQAQQRLHRVWQRLDAECGKRRTIVAVAVARELAGFCWAITRTRPD